MDPNKLPRVHLKLLFLLFNLFLFFNLNFLRNVITTEKVAVSTDDLVDSKSKLIHTSKTLVIDFREILFFKKEPERSLLKTISAKKFLSFFNSTDFERIRLKGINQYAVFAPISGILHYLEIFSEHAKKIGSIAFSKPVDYHERLVVFEMRRNMKEAIKRFINSR